MTRVDEAGVRSNDRKDWMGGVILVSGNEASCRVRSVLSLDGKLVNPS